MQLPRWKSNQRVLSKVQRSGKMLQNCCKNFLQIGQGFEFTRSAIESFRPIGIQRGRQRWHKRLFADSRSEVFMSKVYSL